LVDLASAQDDVEECYADVDTEEEIKANPFQNSLSSEENEDDLEWHHKLLSYKAAVYGCMREQNGINKATVPSMS
jgi:hypothetical protein